MIEMTLIVFDKNGNFGTIFCTMNSKFESYNEFRMKQVMAIFIKITEQSNKAITYESSYDS